MIQRRGQVWEVKIPGVNGRKPYLILSQNNRNQHFDSVVAVRITTTLKRKDYPSNYELQHIDAGCVAGVVLGDSITELFEEDFVSDKPICSLAPSTMLALRPKILNALGW